MNLNLLADRAHSLGVHVVNLLDSSIVLSEDVEQSELAYDGHPMLNLSGRSLSVQRNGDEWSMRVMDKGYVYPSIKVISSIDEALTQLAEIFPERLS